MSVKNSGSHLVVELSTALISRFFHRLFQGETWMPVACELWPLPNRVFTPENRADGAAMLVTQLDDGSRHELFFGLGLHDVLMSQIDLEVAAAVQAGECAPPANFQEKLDCLLRDVLPQPIAQLGVLPPGVILSDFMLRALDNGAGIAVGLFFTGSTLAHAPQTFNAFSTDFLGGRDLALSTSVELLDAFVAHNPAARDLLQQSGPLGGGAYTPDDVNNLATLTASPPDRLRLAGSGEFHTEDCDVDADWWVLLSPSIQDGFLKLRAEFDYDASDWDIFTCIAGSLLLGAAAGIWLGNWLIAGVGALLNLPGFDLPGAGDGASAVSCGDQCFEVTIPNPASADGRLAIALGTDSLAVEQIAVEGSDVTVRGSANLTMPSSELQIRDARPWIQPTAASACAGGAPQYSVASFTLFNPHSPAEAELLGDEWPLICHLEFPPKPPGQSALSDFAEIALVGPHAAAGTPFRVHGVHQQRVEVRVRPNAVPVTLTSSVIVRTNTPPFTRHVRILVDTQNGVGPLQVDPPLLEFEQRNGELVNMKNFDQRQHCGVPAPAPGAIVPLGASFKIRNAGGGLLHVCNLALNDPNGVFELRHAKTFTLSGLSEANVAVSLNANAQVNRQYTATITVVSTDPQHPQVDVTVRATALDPPQGIGVGGRIAVVDNMFDVACLELLAEGPEIAVDLERWKGLFTDPAPGGGDWTSIFEVALEGPEGLDLTVRNGAAVAAQGKVGAGPLALTLPSAEMTGGAVKGFAGGAAAHLKVRSFGLAPAFRYQSQAAAQDLWAAGDLAALATRDELRLFRLDGKAVLLGSEAMGLTRLAGAGSALYGLSARGVESFLVGDKLTRRAGLALTGALDLAVGGGGTLVYALTAKGISVVDTTNPAKPVLLRVITLSAAKRILAHRSRLYTLGDKTLTWFGLDKPATPQKLGALDLPQSSRLSGWHKSLAVSGANGTRMYRAAGAGVAEAAVYPKGHWASALVGGRSFSSLEADGFTVWQVRRRSARPVKG
jgi:hypothetical protein